MWARTPPVDVLRSERSVEAEVGTELREEQNLSVSGRRLVAGGTQDRGKEGHPGKDAVAISRAFYWRPLVQKKVITYWPL